MSETSAMTIAVNIFTSPAEAFRAIRQTPKFWLPLLLLMLGVGADFAYYFSGVDLQWFFEQMFSQSGRLTDAQVSQAVESVSQVPQAGISALVAVVVPIFLLVGFFVSAFYYKIVTWITKDEISYKHWFAVVCWSALPALLGAIATLVNLATNDFSLMPITSINPLTIPNLLGLRSSGNNALDQLLSSYDLTRIWSFILMIVGYKVVANRSWGFATLIVLIPNALLVGIAYVRA